MHSFPFFVTKLSFLNIFGSTIPEFTIVNILGLYLIVRYQLKKEQQKFAEKFGKLNLDKVSIANKQKINKEILSASIFSKI